MINGRWRLKQLLDSELYNASFKSTNSYSFENGFTPKEIWKSTLTKIEGLKQLGVERLVRGEFSCQDDWVIEMIDKYYNDDYWFKLIGIKRVQRELNPDGTIKNLRYVKTMVNKFLDFFGLKTEKAKTVRGARLYVAKVPDSIQGLENDYLPDIDACLRRRRDRLIEKAAAISLHAAVQKYEAKVKSLSTSQDTSQVGCNEASTFITTSECCTPDDNNHHLLTMNTPRHNSLSTSQDNSQLINVPSTNSVETTLDVEEVQGSVCLLQECIHEPSVGGFQAILALTAKWTQEFKAAVWSLLSRREQNLVWRMKYNI